MVADDKSAGRRCLGRVPKELLGEVKDVRDDRNTPTSSLNVRIRPGRAALHKGIHGSFKYPSCKTR